MNKFTSNSYFLGCPHLNHKNICRGVSNWPDTSHTRDFDNLQEMNKGIIDSINKVVDQDDNLFLLGDILFGPKERFWEFYDQINCDSIHLIFGNHDDFIREDHHKLTRFTSASDYMEIEIEKQKIILFHYPILEWRDCHKGSWNICSHSHGGNKFSNYKTSVRKCLDVGWDLFGKPLSFEEIKQIMLNKGNTGHH